MNAAKPADGLLSGGQTIALLETLGKSVNGMTEEQAARDMGVQRAASYARTFNSITMLEAAGLVLRDQERVRSAPSSSIGWRSEIAAWAAGQIADRMARSGAHAMQLHIGRIVLDPMQLPGPIDGLRLWLIEFGVASRTGSSSRHWFVEKDFEGFFIDAARRWNVGTRRRISQEALETRLEDQAANGAAAEEWMLGREQLRLATHPLVEQVTRVSIENAGAGFDIISFSTPSAIVHDHFIEVKSFSGRRRFFWTRNEMETARRLGEAYHLCIVDRDRIYHSDYSPEIISGPYAALIETDDNGWLISPTTFECVGIDG